MCTIYYVLMRGQPIVPIYSGRTRRSTETSIPHTLIAHEAGYG
jgi:hypothetical protein